MPFPDTGAWTEQTSFVLRRIACGDLEETDPPEGARAASAPPAASAEHQHEGDAS